MSEHPPGPLEHEKRGPTVRGKPQPEAAEVESARTLANDAKGELKMLGLPDDRVVELADEFIALDRGTSTTDFVHWVRERVGV